MKIDCEWIISLGKKIYAYLVVTTLLIAVSPITMVLQLNI